MARKQSRAYGRPRDESPPCCPAGRAALAAPAPKSAVGVAAIAAAAAPSRAGMVLVPGGEFLMGTDDREGFPADGEGPVRRVRVDPFFIDSCAVTNDQFAAFVLATGYKTEAERYGWSFVFAAFVPRQARARVIGPSSEAPWWVGVKGAYWPKPEGPGSSIKHRRAHPVVHVSWNDARAYCAWAGKRLPTEAEWEYAARGGLEQKRYPWGDELTPEEAHRCNIWQGRFPHHNTGEDGYVGTAPVDAFPLNGLRLHNVSGNVWEWCADWFSPTFHRDGPHENPQGPPVGEAKVIRGGSYLCHASYCNRYRVAARSKNAPDASTGHMGFRCAADP